MEVFGSTRSHVERNHALIYTRYECPFHSTRMGKGKSIRPYFAAHGRCLHAIYGGYGSRRHSDGGPCQAWNASYTCWKVK